MTGNRIAIVMPLAQQRGGSEMLLMHLLRANRHGPQIDYRLAFLEDGPLVAEAARLGYSARVFLAGQLREGVRYWATVRHLRQWFRQEKVNAVLSWMSKSHLYAGPAAWGHIPAVWYQHGIPDRHWMARVATRIPSRAIFCCSQAAAAAQVSLPPTRPCPVIYPAVDLAAYNVQSLPLKMACRMELGLPPDAFLIGVVARLQRQKGIHVLVEAAAALAADYPHAHYVVVGGEHPLEPEYAEGLTRQVAEAGLTSRVSFAGHQTSVATWMQAMDVLTLPSIGAEGFGMVVVEAMALGKVVIASRLGGPPEIIEDGVDGVLVDPGDTQSLMAALAKAMRGGQCNQRMGLAAEQKAETFGTARFASEVARHLQEVCLS